MSPPEPRRLILCADDFALSDGISATIAELAGVGRLSAVSCMAAADGWAAQSPRLKGLGEGVAVGLHIVLSDERPLGHMPRLAPGGRLPGCDPLALMAHARRLPLCEIADEVTRQFDAFQAEHGAAPDFVDGHQHVHMLPGVRAIVLEVMRRRAPLAWVRDCTDRLGAVLRRPFPMRALRSGLLSHGLAEDAARAGLRSNHGFSGYYDFRSDYAALFPRFLAHAGPFHLVMCHPGRGEACGDAIAQARVREAQVLASPGFDEMLDRAGLSLTPYRAPEGTLLRARLDARGGGAQMPAYQS